MAPKIPEEYKRFFKGAGLLFGHDWLKLAALSYGESGFNPNAVSAAGARGLFQFMEPAWKRFGQGVWDNAFNPQEAAVAAGRYLEFISGFLRDSGRFDPVWEVVGYNCGETAAKGYRDWKEVPEKSRRWIANILRVWAEWLDEDLV